jgi:hypothetical protein
MLTGCFKMSSDASALRDTVMKASAGKWDQEIEFGVGALAFKLAHAGLALVDLDPELRAALTAAHSADVGVYRLRDPRKNVDFTAAMSGADKAMTQRGWSRMVTVFKPHEWVAIYVPSDEGSLSDFKVCLVVLNDRELVVAAARSNLQPLMDVAFGHRNKPNSPLTLILSPLHPPQCCYQGRPGSKRYGGRARGEG